MILPQCLRVPDLLNVKRAETLYQPASKSIYLFREILPRKKIKNISAAFYFWHVAETAVSLSLGLRLEKQDSL